MTRVDRESAEEWLQESIRRLHTHGWFITGSIELIDYSTCPTCGTETLWDGKEHLCPVCCVAVRLLRPTRPDYVGLARSYLTKLIQSKGLEPQPDLMGLCTQIDNMLTRVPPQPKPNLSFVIKDGEEDRELREANQKLLRKTLGVSDDAPICSNCGGLMIRSGTCYTCIGCATTSGCS